ncbi:hypothetical protein AciM339_0807 [Aciduliprofundum sp. MAR08-339]|uniref:DUF354 domain-containing protein n=1 Tax=Aciduliprofundum sp. (strain MAR08-339) TaxID=673860 RepID=UPI0002A47C58|nr:hypothetical protein AciM339_0807 [Aciduliprofundum sp. MAR08-339]
MPKILFDAYTPPDIQLYESISNELKKHGFEIEFVIPNNEECINLIKKKGFPYKIVGSRSNKSFISKGVFNIIRFVLMFKYIYRTNPTVVISRAISTPIAAKIAGKKVFMFIDNDAATLALLLTLPLADRIYMPEAIKIYGNISPHIEKKVYFYRGIEEQIYLSEELKENIYKELNLEKNKDIIVVRPFGLITEYETSGRDSLEEILKDLVFDEQIINKYHIIVLPRTVEQKTLYEKIFKNGIIIPKTPLDGQSLLIQSKIFIGAGGTMSREAWILGNTVFSFYKGKELSVEKWLKSQKNYYYGVISKTKILKEKHKKNFFINTKLRSHIVKDIIENIIPH